ncbi:hypothetical protein DSUL_60198 [Desulfovibrionales bacterium]
MSSNFDTQGYRGVIFLFAMILTNRSRLSWSGRYICELFGIFNLMLSALFVVHVYTSI